MANFVPFTEETLVQFRLLRKVENPVITVLKPEDPDAGMDRKLDLVGTPAPVKHMDKLRAKAPQLLKLLKARGLVLNDIESQVRSGKGGSRYNLLTLKFGPKPADNRARRKALEGDGVKLAEEFFSKPYGRVMFSTFPKEPTKCSLHFNGEMEPDDIAEAIIDAEAANYGLVLHNPKPKVEQVESTS